MSRRRSRRSAQRDPHRPTDDHATAAEVPASPARSSEALSPDLLASLELSMQLEQRAADRARGVDPGPLLTDPDAPQTYRVVVPIAGMTCRSCEVRIERSVRRLPDILAVHASAVRGQVEIESASRLAPVTIARAIGAAGYEIGTTPWVERDPRVWATAGAGLLLVAALAVAAQMTGISGLASGAGDLSDGGVLVALLLGLAAGFSTCMALVGGLVLALSAAFQAGRATASVTEMGVASQMRPALLFVIGRIAGYALFGAGLGAIGASLTMPPQVTATLMIGVAVAMTLLGTRLTGLSPRIAGWSPTLPMGLGRRLGLDPGGAGTYSDARAATMGALSFFLPCGFTQAVQIYALSTGSPVFAAVLLGAFAIGTAPGLLALAGLPVVVPTSVRPTLLRLVGVVVLAFAFVNASAGFALAGIAIPLPGAEGLSAGPTDVTVTRGVQTLATTQVADGYTPSDVTIYAGIPTEWTIDSKTSASCAASIVIPALDRFERLSRGPNVIDLPALPVGVLRYSCAMGMYGGRIRVVAAPTGVVGSGAPGG